MKNEESTQLKTTHEYIVCHNRGEDSKHELNIGRDAEIVTWIHASYPEEGPALKCISPCQKLKAYPPTNNIMVNSMYSKARYIMVPKDPENCLLFKRT